MKKIFFAIIALALFISAASTVYAAKTYENDMEGCVSYMESARALAGVKTRSGKKSVLVNSSGSDLVGAPAGYSFNNSRRVTLMNFNNTVLPASEYSVTIWVLDESGKLADVNDTDQVLITFHGATISDENVKFNHNDEKLTPVKLLLSAKDSDFTATGKKEEHDGNTWAEYTASFTTAVDVGQFSIWMHCPKAYAGGAKKNIFIDDITVTEIAVAVTTAAPVAATTAAVTTKAPETTKAPGTTKAAETTSVTTAESKPVVLPEVEKDNGYVVWIIVAAVAVVAVAVVFIAIKKKK